MTGSSSIVTGPTGPTGNRKQLDSYWAYRTNGDDRKQLDCHWADRTNGDDRKQFDCHWADRTNGDDRKQLDSHWATGPTGMTGSSSIVKILLTVSPFWKITLLMLELI